MLALLAVVGGVVPLALAWHFGALGIPRNDDWAYAHSAFLFADSGHLSGGGWAGMNLVGQLVLAYPVVAVFGHRIAALQIEVAALGVLGLFATFDLATQLLSRRRSLFVAVLVAVLPMWASLSASFMTDIPSFALAMVCLAFGARALDGATIRAGSFYASLAAGFFAFTIRENAIVAPLAVCAVAVVMADRRPGPVRRSAVITAIAGVLVASALFFVWHRSLPGFIHERPHLPTRYLLGQAALITIQAGQLVGLLLIPALLVADPRRLLRFARRRAPRVARGAACVVAVVAGASVLQQRSRSGLLGPGDYVLPNGTLGTGTLKGLRPDLMPRSLLMILAICAACALVVCVATIAATAAEGIESLRRQRLEWTSSPASLVVMLAATGYSASCVLAVAVGYSRFFDRYLIPIVPLVAILTLRSGTAATASRRLRIAGCAALVGMAVFGAVYAANSAAFDGTKWSVASRAVAFAGDAKRVDGGRVWNDNAAGRHLRGHFKGACVVLRAGPRPAAGAAGVVEAARVWGPMGTQTWVVAREVGATACNGRP